MLFPTILFAVAANYFGYLSAFLGFGPNDPIAALFCLIIASSCLGAHEVMRLDGAVAGEIDTLKKGMRMLQDELNELKGREN